MTRSLLSRLAANLLTVIAVGILTFFLLHVVPGGPFDQERELPPEIKKNLLEKYHLRERGENSFASWFWEDVKSYGTALARGDLGPSLKHKGRDVGEIMKEAAPASLELGFLSLMTSLILGVGLGIVAGKKPGGGLDGILSASSSLSVSLPGFVLAILMVTLFANRLGLLPPALWESPAHRVLPIVVLSAAPAATFFRFARSSMMEQLRQDFIRTARAKGVPERFVLLKHAARNALSPVLTLIGPMGAALIGGSFVVETIFAIPGLGRHFVTSVIDRDYFLVMGTTIAYAIVLIALNWLVDLGYLFLDPRMRRK